MLFCPPYGRERGEDLSDEEDLLDISADLDEDFIRREKEELDEEDRLDRQDMVAAERNEHDMWSLMVQDGHR